MKKLMTQIGVCALILGLQVGVVPAMVSAAPITMNTEQIPQQEAIDLAEKQQEIWRHEQAMLQRENESVADWQWRQFLEREQHIVNMQKLQRDGMVFIGTPVAW